MGLQDKFRKIKHEKFWSLPAVEKTGVVNGLVFIGTIAGAFLSIQKEASAEVPSESTCESGESSSGSIPTTGWEDHCWWNHCWSNWSDAASGP